MSVPLNITQLAELIERLDAIENDFPGGPQPKHEREACDLISQCRYDLMETTATTRARSLPELIPQLGCLFNRVDALLGFAEGAILADDLKAIRFALASALLVLRDHVPAAELRCGHLIEEAERRGFNMEEEV
jgi:hypothetical protein